MDAATEEEFMGSSNNNNNQVMIVKRRRTKRLRKSSPCLSLVATSSSSSDVDGSSGGGDGSNEIRFLIPSDHSNSSEISTSLEEDEDMANCLILLAQSGYPRQVEKEVVKMGKNGSKHCASSRGFSEMVATTGKVGIYVYECKTCNRSFPSFQALGGHRASHKKPKIMQTEDHRLKITSSNDDQHEEQHHEDGGQLSKIQPIPKKASQNDVANKVKIHECSICGLEFLSGQALGGHMRRHRNIPISNKGTTMNIVDTSTSTTTTAETSSSDGGKRLKIMRKLDLNLPAPPEDDGGHDLKFQYLGNQQQQHPFSSSPVLVDCHY